MAILFEHLFTDIILERGFAYFEEGAIRRLKGEGHQIYAKVEGSEDYSVYITLKDDGIESLDCSCPYFQGGHNCKHLAAVFYALDETEAEEGELEVYSDLSLALTILESLPKEDLMDFFRSVLEWNEDLRTRFLNLYQGRGSLSESLYHRQIDSVFAHHLGRQDYIDYDQVDSFSSDVRDILSSITDLLAAEEYHTAWNLAEHLVENMSTLAIDDSMGTTSWIMGELIDLVKGILDEGPASMQDNIFEWLYAGLREDFFDDHAREWMDVLMIYFFKEDQLQRKLILIDEVLRHYGETRVSRRAPIYMEWLSHKLKILWALGLEEEANELVRDNSDLPELGLLAAEHHLRRGNDQKAIKLLQEGKVRFKDHWGMANRYSGELMKIYRRRGEYDALRNEGLRRVLDYAPGRVDAYLEYKELFPPQEWIGERDYILYRLKEKQVNLKEIYAEEGLWEDLLAALQEGFDHWDLDRYEKLLKGSSPEGFRDLLVKRVIDLAEYAGGRKHYIRIRYELKKIAGYPGGTPIVEKLKQRWSKQYKNRPAMMEELRLKEWTR